MLSAQVSPQLTGFTRDVKVKRFSSLEECVSVYVTVGVIDYTGVLKDASLSVKNIRAIFPSMSSLRKTNRKYFVTAALCGVFGATVRGPTARELNAVGL